MGESREIESHRQDRGCIGRVDLCGQAILGNGEHWFVSIQQLRISAGEVYMAKLDSADGAVLWAEQIWWTDDDRRHTGGC